MKTIYNIYENNYYNSILGKTTDKVKTVKNDIINDMNSFKERFIKIVSLAGQLNDRQESVFREFVNDCIAYENGKYIHCYFPTSIINHLIVSSGKKLTKRDFIGFPNNKRDYEFTLGMWYMHFNTISTDLTSTKYLYGLPENTVQTFNNNYRVIRLGKVAIIHKDNILYIWIDKVHRIFAMFDNSATRSACGLDYSMTL